MYLGSHDGRFPDCSCSDPENDMVVARYTATGTHLGELWGIEPARVSGAVTGTSIYRIENGKIAERWNEYDRLGMMQQMGIVPEQPTA